MKLAVALATPAVAIGTAAVDIPKAHAYECRVIMNAPRTQSEETTTHAWNKTYQPDGHVHWSIGPFKIGESRFYSTAIYDGRDGLTDHDCIYGAPWYTRPT